MRIRCETRFAVGILVLALFVPGCRKAKAPPEPEAETPEAKKVSLTGPEGAGVGASASRRAVVRTVELHYLQQFGQFYMAYVLDNDNRPPQNVEALGLERAAPNIYRAIKDGDLIVFWGIDSRTLPAGTSNTILAYPKVEARPGTIAVPVAFFDGSARTMTPADFEKAPKGGK